MFNHPYVVSFVAHGHMDGCTFARSISALVVFNALMHDENVTRVVLRDRRAGSRAPAMHVFEREQNDWS